MKTNTLGQQIDYKYEHWPKTVDELSDILATLRKNKKTFNITSTGNNWGYGCYASHNSSDHHISLKNINFIKDFDQINGLVTVGPGVTYQDLEIFLKSNAPEWITPVHGGGPDCSIVGNALERGYGLTPIMDHFSACQSIRAILPDGRKYESPLRSIHLNNLSQKFKYGIGPYLDGIFTQSNMGIVTEMTIKLAPKSDAIELFFLNFEEDQLDTAVEIIKTLKAKYKGIVGGINLMNKERILSMLIDYPEKDIQNRTPISPELIEKYKKEFMANDWNIVGAIYGPTSLVKACKKLIKKDIKKLKAKKIFLSQNKIRNINKLMNVAPFIFSSKLKRSLQALTELLSILNGTPQKTALKLAYWKNLSNKNYQSPTHDNCGLIWYAPLVELDTKNVKSYVSFLNEISKKHNFNPLITLTTVDEMCFDSTIPILFNKEDIKDQQRAHLYFDELLDEGYKRGFYPYRFGTNSMKHFLSKVNPEYMSIIDDIKSAFDPDKLYANGRYHQEVTEKKTSFSLKDKVI